MVTKILYASVNLDKYMEEMSELSLSSMSYDEAKSFFDNDTIECASVEEIVVDGTKPNEFAFDNEIEKDTNGTMFVWVKTI